MQKRKNKITTENICNPDTGTIQHIKIQDMIQTIYVSMN